MYLPPSSSSSLALKLNTIMPSLPVRPLAMSRPGFPNGVAGQAHDNSTTALSTGSEEFCPVVTLVMKVMQPLLHGAFTLDSSRLKQEVMKRERIRRIRGVLMRWLFSFVMTTNCVESLL